MGNKMSFKVIVLLVALFVDAVFSIIFNSGFGYQTIMLQTYFGLCFFVLISREMILKDRLIFGFIYGLILELGQYDTLLLSFLINLMILAFIDLYQSRFGVSLAEKTVLLLSCILIDQFGRYIFMRVFKQIDFSLVTLLTYQSILIILTSIIVILISLMVYNQLKQRDEIKQIKQRSREHISLLD